MSLEKEWKKERIHHKYGSIWLVLSTFVIVALVVVAVTLVKYHRPLYDTVDVVLIVTVGILLGAIFVEGSERLGKSYKREIAELNLKPEKVHDGSFEEKSA